LLWSMAIWMEAAQQRKGRSVDAIKKSNEHPLVINAVGRLFWNERKIEKTRLWLSRAANADPDNGDLWAWWYKFEKQHGEKVGPAALNHGASFADPFVLFHSNVRTM
jgi:pre-mRNA-processing factor 6